MKETSARVYRQIKANGLLSLRRFQTYEAIVTAAEPPTQNEIWRIIKDSGVDLMPNSVTPRLIELERLGVITTAGERRCKEKGRIVNTYVGTDRLPNPAGLPTRRNVWHVVYTKEGQEKPGIKICNSKEAVKLRSAEVGDAIIEVIHFREVIED